MKQPLLLQSKLRKSLKWYYGENSIFPMEAILKQKQLICMRSKMLFTFFQISLFVPEIFKLLKDAD